MNQKSLTPVAIADAIRTPFAKAFGELAGISAVQLGRIAVTASIQRSGIAAADVDEVIMGNVAGPPDAANVARVIALLSGVPEDRIAHTVNRNCASGIESVLQACETINSGRARTVVAGGTESMSQIPLLVRPDAAKLWAKLARSRSLAARLKVLASFRPQHFKPVVGIELGLTDPVSGLNMGQTAEILANEFSVSRTAQDTFAADSHQKAGLAQEAGAMAAEITPVTLPDGRILHEDNGIRRGQSTEKLAKLRPIFEKDGTVTAGNSCQLTDGAAAMVLTAIDDLDRFAGPPLGYITGFAIAGCDPRRMGLGPVYATAKLMRQTGMRLDDFDLIEINEAFAAQVIACQRAMASQTFARAELGRDAALGELPMERVNIHGGAIALGHPVGTTGTRLLQTLLRSLREKGLRRGLATLCVGGGQGVAVCLETHLEV